MAAWLLVLANPQVLKRFLGTLAGKKATLKYGSMLLKSRMTQKDDKSFKQQQQEYAALKKRVAKLEAQLDRARENNDKLSELTFTLERNVVEMQRLLTQMQAQYQAHTQQMQIAMANSRTR